MELPRDVVTLSNHLINTGYEEPSEPMTMAEAVEEAAAMINASERPVIVAGVEIQGFGLQHACIFLRFTEKTCIPVVATILSRSVISEYHTSYLGLYQGAMGDESVRECVESSDCLILLGALMTDIDFGISATPIEQRHSIFVTSEKLSIRHHNFEIVRLHDFIRNLINANLSMREPTHLNRHGSQKFFSVHEGKKITVQHLFDKLT